MEKRHTIKTLIFTLLLKLVFGGANKPVIIETPPEPPRYQPNWDSLDTRPIPPWFDEAKIGIFIHWGIFSVPSYGSGSAEWFWAYWKGGSKDLDNFMKINYPPDFTYQEFAKDFTAEFFDPEEWAKLFKKAGAKYVVITTKHHEGFTLWPSKYSFGWNAKDVGPRRDLVGDLAEALRAKDLTFGVYHSLYEWFNPLYIADKKSSFTNTTFVDNKMLPEMYELINNYKPEIIWSDGDWEANDTYFKSTEFLAWLYNDSPVKDTILTNGRWGIGIPCHHGDFYSCKDRFNPGTLQPHKWENAMTLDKNSWGYRRNADIFQYLTIEELLKTLAETISCGGNLLINVGPTKEGTIVPIFQERLLQLGEWLFVNGEAVYGSKPWTFQNDTRTSGVWYTTDTKNNVYAIVLQWPVKNILQLEAVIDLFNNLSPSVNLLGYSENLKWLVEKSKVEIKFPDKRTVTSQWAWVVKITSESESTFSFS